MKKFYKYFKPEIPAAILGIIFVGSVAFIELYQIQLMAEIIDNGIANSNFDIILSVGLKMIWLALLGAILAILGLVFPSQVSNNFAFIYFTGYFAPSIITDCTSLQCITQCNVPHFFAGFAWF